MPLLSLSGAVILRQGKDRTLADIPRIQLGEDEPRQYGLRCLDCGTKNTVYFISFPLGTAFPAGAYCYACLVKRCRQTRCVPFPIEATLLNKIKADMGVRPHTPPRHFIYP